VARHEEKEVRKVLNEVLGERLKLLQEDKTGKSYQGND
jgi:hypothetical protein